jgi:hypothetical protein
MSKGTDADVADRVEQVEAMLLDGKSSSEVSEHVIREWGLSAATAKNYMARARARTAARLTDTGKLNDLLGWCVHAYRFIYQRCVEREQYAVAKSTLDSMANVLGLARPIKIAVKHEGNGIAAYRDMQDAQLAALITAAHAADQIPDTVTPVEPQEREHSEPH